MLHKDLTELDKSTEETNEMVLAWEKGDVEKIGKIENDELAAEISRRVQANCGGPEHEAGPRRWMGC